MLEWLCQGKMFYFFFQDPPHYTHTHMHCILTCALFPFLIYEFWAINSPYPCDYQPLIMKSYSTAKKKCGKVWGQVGKSGKYTETAWEIVSVCRSKSHMSLLHWLVWKRVGEGLKVDCFQMLRFLYCFSDQSKQYSYFF